MEVEKVHPSGRGMPPWLRLARSLYLRSLPPRWFRNELKGFWHALVRSPDVILEVSGLRRCLADLIAATVALNLLGLALPLILLQVYDRILPNSAMDTLGALVAGIVVAITLEMVLRIARSAVTAWTGGRFEHVASSRVFRSLLHTPLSTFEASGVGAHLETLSAIGRLKDFYAGQAFLTVFDIPFAIVFIGLLALFGGWLALVPVILLVGMAMIGVVAGYRLRMLLRRRMLFDQSRSNFILEALSSIQTVKSLAMEAQLQRRHDRLQENSALAEFHSADLAHGAAALGRLFSSLNIILVVALGSLMVIEGDMSTGVLAACSLLAGRAAQPIQLALDRWTRFQAARLAEERLEGLLEGKADDGAAKPDLPPVSGRMTLAGVHLRYPHGREIVVGADLSIAPGEMIGITGESGTGKSSLLALMGGLVAPTGGTVQVDGLDLAGFAQDSYRSRIGYIAQRSELYRGTIIENLSSFDPAKIDAAREVARDLGIERFVSSLPLGYSTPVASGPQDSLPRGIRQLIAIGRILANRPNILLFDEANTAVDGAGNQALRDMLERLKGRVTIVLVSSRPSLLNLADRTFELADGRLCAAGQASLRPVAENTAAAAAAMMGPMILASLADEDEGKFSSLADADFLRGLRQASPLGRCLVPMLEAMRWCSDPRRLAESMPHGQSKLDIVSFRNVMANLGFGSSSIDMRGEPVERRLLPCLFMAVDGTPMVLLDAGHDHVTAYDGTDGNTKAVSHGHLWGTAYFFTPVDAAAARPGQWLQSLKDRFRGLVWAILAQSLLINILSLGVPLFTMSVYDKVIGSGDARMLVGVLGGVGIVVAAEHVLQELRSRANAYMGVRLSYIVSAMVFERTLALPLQVTERVGIAGQLSRFRELESLRTLFTDGLAVVLLDLPFVFLYVVVLFILGGPVALVPVLALGAFFLVLTALMPLVRSRVAAMARMGNQRQEFVIETLTKMRSLHSDGLQDVWEQRFRAYSADAAMAGRHAASLSGALTALSQAMVVVAGIATMTVGVHQVLDGRMSAGALIASMMVVWRVLAPMQAGFWLLQRLEQARGTIRQVEGLMGLKTESDDRPMGDAALRLRGAVSFSRVSIRYSSDADPALLGVSFQARPGEVIAVVGPDGSGKSTLLKLIAGLYQPQAGNVIIDDMDIRQIDPVALRKTIAYAPQVPELLFGTIAQNLRLAHPNASKADLWHALDMAGVRDEVEHLPAGLDTRVGDSHNNSIPGSLAQGLSLARAYLKHSPIILLDEPVTGLDSEGDRKFREFIEWARGLTTIFLVTHRPSHLSLADQILVLDKGSIRISGPASEVRAKLAG